MTNKVKLNPSQHIFSIEKHETILEAALRSGLCVDYGCSNGTCGKCAAKLICGEVEKTGHQDYVFSEAEKRAGQILMCCYQAKSDVALETKEASHTDEIQLQRIKVKIKKIETPIEGLKILHVRSPRTQRLRYIAGQRANLINSNNESRSYSIASCPCDALNQQFHLPFHADDNFLASILGPDQRTLEIEGPHGSFVLQEKSTRPVLFLAYNSGFGAIKGLIEHALSLELSQAISLVWITDVKNGHYMHNYCRSIGDAVDNFEYVPLTLCCGDSDKNESKTDRQLKNKQLSQTFKDVIRKHQNLDQYDIYIAGDTLFSQSCGDILSKSGAIPTQMYLEVLSHSG